MHTNPIATLILRSVLHNNKRSYMVMKVLDKVNTNSNSKLRTNRPVFSPIGRGATQFRQPTDLQGGFTV
jgi:hypothetical protein